MDVEQSTAGTEMYIDIKIRLCYNEEVKSFYIKREELTLESTPKKENIYCHRRTGFDCCSGDM